ncbi:protein regulator of cytokinesis 1-like [Phymastichus coffea]|uniref:protein regulator of cytokinesis 1-like n=1 Tax=Phymastichus coffea TaxID=108790 RepID=UPI00273BD0DA|nr:protein regulator of cytokinesis 1-like [Phymastichus coffea]
MSSVRSYVVEKAKSICDEQITELFNVWEETGIKNEILSTYGDQVLNHLVSLMKDMVDESILRKKSLLKSVKSLAQTARKLSKELGTHFATDSHDDFSLLDLELHLKKQVETLQHLKEQRLQYTQELLTKEIEICKKLGVKPNGFHSELPTADEIKEFEAYLKKQETEKNRMTEIFKDTRRSIMKMMEELQINPALDFERMICQDHNQFIFSSTNMTKVRDLKDRLKEQVEQAKTQVEEKKETLISLWDYLDEPMKNRQAFFEAHQGYSLITLSALNAEIKRCRQKRSENIANYVNKVREEIQNLWQLCKYSDLQKRSFTAMKCQTFTEDLLTLHEEEAQNLRKYYNSNRKIFESLSEWEAQFEKLKHLDQRANDPDRYHNRGGQLLAEEKERKTADKKLPKLENQLYALVDEYERVNKKSFLINGYPLREFIQHIRENYEIEKENMKIARKQAKDRSVRKTPLSTSKRTPGASVLRITPASSRLLRTPGGNNMSRATPAAKRKLPYDVSPNTSECKKRVIHTEKNKATVLHNKVRRSSRTAGGALNGSSRAKLSNKKKRKSKNDTMLSVSSYGNFQEHLDDRDELRSSALPEELAKRTESKTPMKTSMKTPIKPLRKKVLAVSTPANPNATRLLRGTPRLIATPRLVTIRSSSPVEV